MLRIIVLGSAAGGGLPQWNCNCAGCRTARAEPALRNGQCALAASADGESWFLVNASPDLRQQILDTPALHPRHGLRHSPIAGVILTNAEVDAVAGLLTLREGWPFAIHAHPDVLEVLAANPIFGVLRPEIVPRRPMLPETPFEPVLACGRASGLTVRSFAVPGKPALWREEEGAAEGDSIGLELSAGGRRAFILPGCAEVTPALACRLAGADLVFFDGTLWQDDEMIRAGLSQKTGRRMGHISMSGPAGAMAALDPLGIARKVFVHINNSNPVLMPGSPERAEAERAGWCVPGPGMEFVA
ncbi:pyrroloquinoline quinone biosynthesis protein PqqB [Cereibacter johrii]|uniref:Coenzyme PQQ synthesis protein B n=1 Tax=Cereibacter johrii TaxID=445629 RepID=A0ABX5J7U1_9RHOB|nr:pyrroloquinoline quinone biosynthesis protein PqqB [Cereibacter johrii]ODM45120.1 pyrroloquinoline quinone biosynthesis protein PqqB [Cereibacter johrii]PTM79261.1 pyrroloquinoline quinone biosynthesis protein B [Cereibacter johrii]RDS97260.1 pyrroloquinoline quinone biosynthesis protein PqqB [Cereibacter sphaeroides f. sp. denitrificans]